MPERTRISELLATEDQRALLDGLFSHAPVAMQIYAPDGHCLLVNDAFRQLFGSEPPPEYNILKDEIGERNGTLGLVHRAFAGETVHMPALWYDPRTIRQVEVLEARAAGVEIAFLPLHDSERRVRYVALCFKDVTAEIKLKQERARISRDLHDSVATELTALVWKTREISASLPAGSGRHELESFGERLRGALSDLRDVVVTLRRSRLGVRDTLDLLERRCRELSGELAFTLDVRGEPEVSEPGLELDEVWGDALPICFELVRNAAHHSGGRSIRVELELGGQLLLVVTDDGSSLESETFERSSGGLLGVRQRVSELGGSVELRPSDAGTTIVVALPR